jgi:hypothetical protein
MTKQTIAKSLIGLVAAWFLLLLVRHLLYDLPHWLMLSEPGTQVKIVRGKALGPAWVLWLRQAAPLGLVAAGLAVSPRLWKRPVSFLAVALFALVLVEEAVTTNLLQRAAERTRLSETKVP